MIKSFELITDRYPLPILVVRTDGTKLQIVEDLTGGSREPQTLEELQTMVSTSSHLSLKPTPDTKMAHHVLSNNDVLSVSEDGLTAALNGKLLADDEKAQLLKLMDSGVIKMQGVTS
jgi:hypothetical protein